MEHNIPVAMLMQVSIWPVTIPRAPRGFCTEMCAQPQSFCTTENARGQTNKWWYPWGRAFASTQSSGLKNYIYIVPGKVQKTQNAMSNCLFALGSYISPMTNVLLTDLGLGIPLSFIDKCVSTSVHSTIYWQCTFETSHLSPLFDLLYLIYFHRQIQGIKSIGNVKQAASFVWGKPQKNAYVSIVTEEYLGFPHSLTMIF